ncbi:7863_t:CDS:1, partial [Rhizophagus irregularis]
STFNCFHLQSLFSLFNDSSESVNDLESNGKSNTSSCKVVKEKHQKSTDNKDYIYKNKWPIGISNNVKFFESNDEIKNVYCKDEGNKLQSFQLSNCQPF